MHNTILRMFSLYLLIFGGAPPTPRQVMRFSRPMHRHAIPSMPPHRGRPLSRRQQCALRPRFVRDKPQVRLYKYTHAPCSGACFFIHREKKIHKDVIEPLSNFTLSLSISKVRGVSPTRKSFRFVSFVRVCVRAVPYVRSDSAKKYFRALSLFPFGLAAHMSDI